jgi:CpcD/allophycocyanin linker domain
MLGLSSDRAFVYEVEGLRQTEQTTQDTHPIRSSGNLMIQVPYKRMNEEMRRISRLGGKIVAIHPLSDYLAAQSQNNSQHDSQGE